MDPKIRLCERNRIHPAHQYISARRLMMCPGILPEVTDHSKALESLDRLAELLHGMTYAHPTRETSSLGAMYDRVLHQIRATIVDHEKIQQLRDPA